MISIHNSFLNQKLQNSIFNNISSFTTSLQRLITGFKINSPSDDPAGFYVSSKFLTQIRGLETANKNIQTAVNMLNMADSSIKEINDIMGEIRELVAKGCNEYMTDEERASNQAQINKLFEQAQSIKNSTEYNGNKLFSTSTILDKNKTYTNDKEGTVTTASNQVLTLRSSEDATAASSSPDEAVALASTFSLRSYSAAAPAAYSADTTVEDWGTSGSKTIANGETVQASINGLVYTITNNSGYTQTLSYATDNNNNIRIDSDMGGISNFEITAADGQDDKLIICGSYNTINTGDGNDTVEIDCAGGYHENTINLGDGDDVLTIGAGAFFNTVDGGNGNDILYDFERLNTDTTSSNITKLTSDYNEITFNANETKQVTINGSVYTIQNNSSYENTLGYININSYNSSLGSIISDEGKAYFEGSEFTITTASGQNDYILLNGSHNILNTGDGDDTVIIPGYHCSGRNTINVDSGDNIVINRNSTNIINGTYYESADSVRDWGTSGTKIISKGQSITALIGDKTYTFENNTNTDLTITYSTDADGRITINNNYYSESTSDGMLTITAADGQTDNIHLLGANIEFFAGDMDDTISVGEPNNYTGSVNNIIHGGDGNDTITMSSTSGTVYGDDGDDTVILELGNTNTTYVVDGGSGSNTLINNAPSAEVTGSGFAGVSSPKIEFGQDETKVLEIDNKTYTVQASTSGISLSYSFDENGQITFTTDSSLYSGPENTTLFTITAADGQQDNIKLAGNGIQLNTGDLDDNIIITGSYNTVNAGDGNDIITIGDETESNNCFNTIYAGDGDDIINSYHSVNSTTMYNTIYGEGGNDTANITTGSYSTAFDGGSGTNIINDSGVNTNSINVVSNWGTSGTQTISSGQTITALIGDKVYTFKNDIAQDLSIDYSVDSNGQITINNNYHEDSSSGLKLEITAAANQQDYIKLVGDCMTLNTGDLDDNVVIQGSGNTVNAGDGDDTIDIIEGSETCIAGDGGYDIVYDQGTSTYLYDVEEHHQDWGTSGSKTISSGLSVIAHIGDKVYTFRNDTNSTLTIDYSTDDNGKITINNNYYSESTSDGMLTITAADGQTDNVHLLGANIEFFAGDMDDTISVGEPNNYTGSVNNIIHGGDGNDTITMSSTSGTVYGDDGDDTVILELGNTNTTYVVDGGSGSNTLINNAPSAEVTATNFEEADIIQFSAGETKTVEIDGKTYFVKNNGSDSNEFKYTVGTDGAITFESDFFEITAGDNQEDNIIIKGSHNIVDTGDGNDTINLISGEYTTVYNFNTVYAGDGDDIIIAGHGTTYNKIYTQDGNDSVTMGGFNNGTLVDGGFGDDVITGPDNYYDSDLISGFHSKTSGNIVLGYHDAEMGKTLKINGKEYIVKMNSPNSTQTLEYSYDEASGAITFEGNYLNITAADGQQDIIILKGHHNIIDTGDLDDIIKLEQTENLYYDDPYQPSTGFNTEYNTIYAGSGNDAITIESGANNNYVYGETGDDSVTVNGNYNYLYGDEGNNLLNNYGTGNSAQNFNSANEGVVEAAAGESKTISIGGKTYTITNTLSQTNSLEWSYNTSTGEITFSGKYFDVTAASNQTDNIIWGIHTGTLDTGDENDTIKTNQDTHSSSIISMSGDNYIEVNGDNSVFQVLTGNGNDTVKLNGNYLKYTDTGGDNDITVNGSSNGITVQGGNNNILLEGSKNTITAADGDNTILLAAGSHFNTIETGNGDDSITINNGSSNIVTDNGGNNTITLEGPNAYYNTITTGSGNDNITFLDRANFNTITDVGGDNTIILATGAHSNTIETGTGNDNITINGDCNTITDKGGNNIVTVNVSGNTIQTGDGADKIFVNSGNNTVNTNGGNDYVIVNGDKNTIDGGTTGYDKIKNNGTDNTYTHMDELIADKNSSYSIQTDSNINDYTKFNISISMLLPEMNIDISSRDKAIEALKQIDEVILGLTTSRVDIEFQNSMLDSIMKSNLTRITNLNNSLSTVRDADTAAEYNNLIAKAALIDTGRLLQIQAAQNQANLLSQLINSIAS